MNFIKDEKGQSYAEYAILSLVIVIVLGVMVEVLNPLLGDVHGAFVKRMQGMAGGGN